jgi:hypothetical protein
MNRCAVALLPLAAVATVASAQVPRLFPPTALRGELAFVQPPDVLLNGQPARLAPGARVRNEENRFEVMGALAGRKQVVHFTRDAGGQLLEVWLLTPSERARQPWPTSEAQARSWQFDPVAQIWSRP